MGGGGRKIRGEGPGPSKFEANIQARAGYERVGGRLDLGDIRMTGH